MELSILNPDEDLKIDFDVGKPICRCCLTTEREMLDVVPYDPYFRELAGISVMESDGLPQWVCWECTALLQKAVRFKHKMLRAQSLLYEYMTRCAPFSIDADPELNKYASPQLSTTNTLSFSMGGRTKAGFQEDLRHETPVQKTSITFAQLSCLTPQMPSTLDKTDEPTAEATVKVEEDLDFSYDDDMTLDEYRASSKLTEEDLEQLLDVSGPVEPKEEPGQKRKRKTKKKEEKPKKKKGCEGVLCWNCDVMCDNASTRRHQVWALGPDVVGLLCNMQPKTITVEDYICEECKDFALKSATQDPLDGSNNDHQSSGLDEPKDKPDNDHKRLLYCLLCPRSLQRKRKYGLIREKVTEEQTAQIEFIKSKVPSKQITESDFVCHPCWKKALRAIRKADKLLKSSTVDLQPPTEDLQPPSPEPSPPVPEFTVLPNYKRVINTGNRCIFQDCDVTSLIDIPDKLRADVLDKHNCYLPKLSLVCEDHLASDNWNVLFDLESISKVFSIREIQDVFSLVNADFDVENKFEQIVMTLSSKEESSPAEFDEASDSDTELYCQEDNLSVSYDCNPKEDNLSDNNQTEKSSDLSRSKEDLPAGIHHSTDIKNPVTLSDLDVKEDRASGSKRNEDKSPNKSESKEVRSKANPSIEAYKEVYPSESEALHTSLLLPGYNRAPNSSNQCIIPECRETSSRYRISDKLRASVLRRHKLYLPYGVRICGEHKKNLTISVWTASRKLPFTPKQIEHAFSLVNTKATRITRTLDFENFAAIDEIDFENLIGFKKYQFQIILDEVPEILNIANYKGMVGLAGVLIKMRTNVSYEKISILFNLSLSNICFYVFKVREAMLRDFNPKTSRLNEEINGYSLGDRLMQFLNVSKERVTRRILKNSLIPIAKFKIPTANS